MSLQTRYYDEQIVGNTYPYVYNEIVKRMKLYFCSLLYPDEPLTPDTFNKRWIRADFVGGGNETAIRETLQRFQNTQGSFPFTCWNVDDDEPVDYKSYTHLSGNYYDKNLDCYIAGVPAFLNLNMMTFYNTEYDYFIATTKFMYDLATATRLEVPIMINDIETQFYIDVDMDVTKGDLAFAYEELRTKGQLFNISHNCKIKFYYYILASKTFASEDGKQTQIKVYPVDDMVLSLKRLEDKTLIDSLHVNVIPEISSFIPANNSTGVSRTDDIVITFNTPMNETSLALNLDIVPQFDKESVVWNDTSTVLTIKPVELSASTEYIFNISRNAENHLTHTLKQDYEFKFTTGI